MQRIKQAQRSQLALERRQEVLRSLDCCRLCVRNCRRNRLAGEFGACGASNSARVFGAFVDVADEPEFIPNFSVSFSGCNLRCRFCVTKQCSQNVRRGCVFHAERMKTKLHSALNTGARFVMILGGEPTIHLPAAIELISIVPDEVPVIWKTNGLCSAVSRKWLDGLCDVWLVDYKFGNDRCAERLAGMAAYTRPVRETLRWANTHSRLVVRHVLVPGHVACCWKPVAAWLSAHVPQAEVSLMESFWPMRVCRQYPELARAVSREEMEQARRIADEYHVRLMG